MSYVLGLPNFEQTPPKQLNHLSVLSISEVETAYGSILQQIKALPEAPAFVLGNELTPGLYWIAVSICFPQSKIIIVNDNKFVVANNGQLFSSDSNEPSLEKVEAHSSNDNQTENSPDFDEDSKNQENKNKKPSLTEQNSQQEDPKESKKPWYESKPSSFDDRELIQYARFRSSWDMSEKEFERFNDEFILEASSRNEINPGIVKRVEQAIKQGRSALKLYTEEVQPRLRNFDFNDYFEELKNNLHNENRHKVVKILELKVNKAQNFIQNKKQQPRDSCTLKPIQFDAHHPNSLRHLRPSTQWDIYIDEGGNYFEGASTNRVNKDTGRMVAVAIPDSSRSKLAGIANHHATEVDPKVNDQIIAALLKSGAGVIGFTNGDSINASHSSWFNGISILIRWVLKLLPLNESETFKTNVKFHIEHRGGYTSEINLLPVINMIEAELLELDYDRFSNVKINAGFVNKEQQDELHPYADVVAHMWTSSARNSNDRLKASRLSGHCLINSNSDTMTRVYQSLTKASLMNVDNWYQIVSQLSNEPEFSLATKLLDDLGLQTRENRVTWQKYLYRVKSALAEKNISLNDLRYLLSWLEKFKPDEEHIPDMLKLHWASARLVNANHLGHLAHNVQRDFDICIQLGQRLISESAREVCEVDLRLATSFSNSYQFDKMYQVIERWLDKSVEVLGWHCYGKLQSTLGQYYAFTNQCELSDKAFLKSMDAYHELSDSIVAKREASQTECYRLYNLLSSKTCPLDEFKAQLSLYANSLSGQNQLDVVAKKLAGVSEYPYLHSLMLKACCTHPEYFVDEIDAYISKQRVWKDAVHHPWGLINFYRAILLYRNNNATGAKESLERMGEQYGSGQSGLTLQWIKNVLQQAASSIGIISESDMNVDTDILKLLQQKMSAVPIDLLINWPPELAEDNDKLFDHLQVCLPFNFH